MLATRNETLEDKRVLISGSGNVAQFAAEKAIECAGPPAPHDVQTTAPGWSSDPQFEQCIPFTFPFEQRLLKQARPTARGGIITVVESSPVPTTS